MSKRNQTTGAPKRRTRTEEDRARREGYVSKSEHQRIVERRVLIAAGIVGAVIVLLILAAVINDQLIVPTRAITTVNDTEVSINEFEDRVKYERFQASEQVRALYNALLERGMSAEDARNQVLATYSGQQAAGGQLIDLLISPEGFGQEVLSKIEEEIIIEQAAEEYGVTAEVDEAAVQEEIDRIASVFSQQSLEVTPSSTPSEVPSETPTPLVSPTNSPTPTETVPPTETVQPTAEGCAEGEECPTVTPLATLVPSFTPTETPAQTETPTPTNTPLEPDDSAATVVAYREDFLEEGGDLSSLSEDDVREIFRKEAVTTAMREFITGDKEQFPDYYVGDDEIWVDARHILISIPTGEEVDEADNPYLTEANELVAAIRAGEPFAAVAEANSDDPSGASGGALNWSSSENYVEGFREAVQTLPLGEVSDPVKSEFGYHIIQVMDREIRPVSEATKVNRQLQEFEEWLNTLRVTVPIERREGWQEFIPDTPDFNDLLGDILGTYDPATGLTPPED